MIFFETPTFAADRAEHLSDDMAFAAFQQMLADQPEVGEVIPGGMGLRKLRISVDGPGKRGSVRVIYFRRLSESQILLVALFAKSVRVDLSARQLEELTKAYRGQEADRQSPGTREGSGDGHGPEEI